MGQLISWVGGSKQKYKEKEYILTKNGIVQLYASYLSNWTVRVIKRALVVLEWLSFSGSSLEVVEYINPSNSLYHCHILLEFYYSDN